MDLRRPFQKIAGRRVPWSKSAIYIDRSVIVLDKPPGLVCQLEESRNTGVKDIPEENPFNVLMDELREKFNLKSNPYPVHRLDKATTGALVLARTTSSAREISQQFQRGTVHKSYLALVRGGQKTFPASTGEIRAPLEYVDGRARISTSGKPSATDWEVLASSEIAPVSLLRLNLLTGHKHQLRVHLAQCLNTPILGDDVHSKTSISDAILRATKVPEDRLFLHASEISLFRYKVSGRHKRFRLGIRAPLPADFLKVCSQLGIRVDRRQAEGGLFGDESVIKDGAIPDVNGYWINQS